LLAVDVYVYLPAEDNQLLDGGGSLKVIGNQKRPFAFFEQILAEFSGGGGFAAALESCEEDNCWAGGDEVDSGIDRPHESCELVIYDFYEDLAGMETFYYIGTDGGLLDILAELLYDVVVDIGFQQGLSDITHGIGDIGLGDSSAA